MSLSLSLPKLAVTHIHTHAHSVNGEGERKKVNHFCVLSNSHFECETIIYFNQDSKKKKSFQMFGGRAENTVMQREQHNTMAEEKKTGNLCRLLITEDFNRNDEP